MSDPHVPGGQRLQKVMAHAGVGSRRVCEDLIARGRVTVDGQVVTSLGTRIDPATAVLHVDGTRVQLDASKVTLALYTPPGVVSTMVDERGRPALAQYVGRVLKRGVTLHDGPVAVDGFVLREAAQRNSIVEITLHSGRNRIVRRIMEEVGHPVMELVRTKFGTVEAGRLKPGKTRVVAGSELGALMRLVDL